MVAFHWLCIGVIFSWGEFGMSTFLKGAIAAEQICDLTNHGSHKLPRIQSLFGFLTSRPYIKIKL